MKDLKIPLIMISTLMESEQKRCGVISLNMTRTLTITARVTYNASATVGCTMNLYYSPDGIHVDSIPYATYLINLAAGETVQESHNVDAPEVGYMQIAISNGDATYTTTNVLIYENQVLWGEEKCKD